ncbi:MAG: DUF5309 family protein [Victivallales bacterium]|nr:DUF5309 family protein [Victivallales bacterium]
MPLYAYSFQNVKRDLNDVLATIVKDEPRFIAGFIPAAPATQQKHEWLEDQIAGRSLSATAVDADTVTASAADVAKLKVGTLLTVKDDTVLFRVESLASATTFTVALVAANGSATTAVTAGKVLNIAGTPVKEGSANGDGDDAGHLSGSDYNYTQIFRKDIVLSGSALAISLNGSVDNQINRQTRIALSELTRDLNRLALFGRRVQPSAAAKGECGGLYCFGTQAGGLSINAADNTFDSFLINDAAQAVLGEGGNPSQILCSPGQARVLSNEYKDQLRIVREDQMRGAYVAVIVNEITGRTMTITADPDLPDTEAWINDVGGFELCPLKDRGITDEDTTPKGFDGIKRSALGELTLSFKNARQRLCRVYGLKASAVALAALRA